MGFHESFIELHQQQPLQPMQTVSYVNYHGRNGPRQPDTWPEHPLMAHIRDTITQYRLQSAAHFDVVIEVKQAFRVYHDSLPRRIKLNVVFANWEHQETYVCRAMTMHKKIKTNKVQVADKLTGMFLPLMGFLEKTFPCFPAEVGTRELQAWWNANGKWFNWTSLPTELKERVIECCLHQTLQSGDYKQMLSRLKDRYRPRGGRREFGIYEIVDQLTDWASLLGVSHQVRSITVRLCLAGKSGMTYQGGFTITASSCCSLDSALTRLSRYYQMTAPNSLPVDDTTQILADTYRQYPRIYPHLDRYATFRHGLRNMSLSMDFIGYMHFFKVTLGSFKHHLVAHTLSYTVLEQLPHLQHIAIKLPLKPHRGWSDASSYQPAPLLFHPDYPCPRLLHRVIYERIAATLTLYPSVHVHGFIDDAERAHYHNLRTTAMHHRKWTPDTLADLYQDCGGGIQLKHPIIHPASSSWLLLDNDDDQSPAAQQHVAPRADDEEDGFFPPKCRCLLQCYKIFRETENKKRRFVSRAASER
ncbi:hypothetical protein ACEQ8H_004354 [Pleosporales sp. CAS-2024a]